MKPGVSFSGGVLFVTLLAAASSLLLAGVERWTAPAVERARAERLKSVLSLAYPGFSAEEGIFSSREVGNDLLLLEAETASVSREPAWALIVQGRGLWGPVELLMVPDLEKRLLRSVTVLEHQETPGIGSRISEREYLDRYSGLSLERPVKVDALTGATKSSQAFSSLVEQGRKVLIKEVP
jgi:Na+-translocating ferredoxin:NAD+ oxidoreductase subunit G